MPLGSVALNWLRLYLPPVAARLPQAPGDAGPEGLGSAGPGFRALLAGADATAADLRIGARLGGAAAKAVHTALGEAARRKPACRACGPTPPTPRPRNASSPPWACSACAAARPAGARLDGLGGPERAAKLALCDRFCAEHRIAERGVPLFAAATDGSVEVFPYGRDGRPMLRRSAAMEAMVVEAVETVLAAAPAEAEGLLHMMHRLGEDGGVVPLCVGKAGRHGRSGAAVSANIAALRANAGRSARRGHNHACRLGDLSAAALPGHSPLKVQPKYGRWARRLFREAPAAAARLREDVRSRCARWGRRSPNIWREFGACPLAFAEYLLIGVAGLLFPGGLLNDEGVNRAASEDGARAAQP